MNNNIISRGKRESDHEWLYGQHVCLDEKYHYILPKDTSISNIINDLDNYKVDPETIGICSNMIDKEQNDIFDGDIVRLLDLHTGIITIENGTFGINIPTGIDWYPLEKAIMHVTNCDNPPCFCYNDNFVSLWELMWNYNQEEDTCSVIEVIGNIYDNKNLLDQN